MADKGRLTLEDRVAGLACRHGITIHRLAVWRFRRILGMTQDNGPLRPRADAA